MDRRALIKLVTLASGAALTIPLSGALLTACRKVEQVSAADYVPLFFEKQDYALLQNLIDFILPKTDSPSGIEVGVDQIMDAVVGTVYGPDQKDEFLKSFALLKPYCATLEALEEIKKVVVSTDEKDQLVKSAFLRIKQQAIAYYLSTEEIAKNYLNYLPIPGKYESCISLASAGGKAWAL